MTLHDGAYSYDNGGRLSQVIDCATNLTEEYTWNADNTLATMPGPSYTREFGYNEEAQLLSISHSGTLAYQYAYGADGNRHWAKDIANNAWTWYPCGVACGAGELVEQGSDLTGTTWTTNAQYLRAGGGCRSMLIRRKSSTDDEYHHEDPLGVFGVITGANAATLSSNVYDASGSLMFATTNLSSPFVRKSVTRTFDSLLLVEYSYRFTARGIILNRKIESTEINNPLVQMCIDDCDATHYEEIKHCNRLKSKGARRVCYEKSIKEMAECHHTCFLKYQYKPTYPLIIIDPLPAPGYLPVWPPFEPIPTPVFFDPLPVEFF